MGKNIMLDSILNFLLRYTEPIGYTDTGYSDKLVTVTVFAVPK